MVQLTAKVDLASSQPPSAASTSFVTRVRKLTRPRPGCLSLHRKPTAQYPGSLEPLDRHVDAVGAEILKSAAFEMLAHRLLGWRQSATAAAFQVEEKHLPVRSGKHQIRPAWLGAEPLEPGRGDRVACLAERNMAKLAPKPKSLARNNKAWAKPPPPDDPPVRTA